MKYSDLKLVKAALRNVNKDIRSPDSKGGPLFVRKFDEKTEEDENAILKDEHAILKDEQEDLEISFELKKGVPDDYQFESKEETSMIKDEM